MSYIILSRNPTDDRLRALTTGDSDDPPIAEYETWDEALRVAEKHPLAGKWPLSIVQVGALNPEIGLGRFSLPAKLISDLTIPVQVQTGPAVSR